MLYGSKACDGQQRFRSRQSHRPIVLVIFLVCRISPSPISSTINTHRSVNIPTKGFFSCSCGRIRIQLVSCKWVLAIFTANLETLHPMLESTWIFSKFWIGHYNIRVFVISDLKCRENLWIWWNIFKLVVKIPSTYFEKERRKKKHGWSSLDG